MRKHVLQEGSKAAENVPASVGTPTFTREQLQQFTNDQLIDLVLLALEGQRMQTQNALRAVETARQLHARVVQLEDEMKTLETKVLTLEARPR